MSVAARKKAPADSWTEMPRASETDPAIVAAGFIDAHSIDEQPTIRFWAGSFYQWKRGAYRELSDSELTALVMQFFKSGWSHIRCGHVANVVAHLRSDLLLPCHQSAPFWIGPAARGFDAKSCLATANAVVHLPSYADQKAVYSVPATPAYFALSACECDLDPAASLPTTWLAVVNAQWPDDPESVAALQEMMGYCLTPDTSLQKIFAIIGPKRSGKGTFARTIRKLVGEQNATGPTLAGLTRDFGLAPLVGKTVAIVSDLRLSNRIDLAPVVERLLSISGEDKLTVDRKNKPAIECQLSTRIIILSNDLPRLPDASTTIVSRMIVLRTTQSFLGMEDSDLNRKLQAELPGILNWGIEGWKRLRDRGRFIQPASSQKLIEGLTQLASPVTAFVSECCELAPEAKCSVQQLYDQFVHWCKYAAGIKAIPTKEVFGRDLSSAFDIDKARARIGDKREYCYAGIRLANETKSHDSSIDF